MTEAGTTAGTMRSGHDLLGIYLNDHLAGATGGAELARRVAGSCSGQGTGSALQRFAAEVAQDRVALLDIMATLGITVRGYKVRVAWIGEKAAAIPSGGGDQAGPLRRSAIMATSSSRGPNSDIR